MADQQKKQQNAQNDQYSSVPTTRLIVTWAIVGIPLLYGVAQTFIKSLALFR